MRRFWREVGRFLGETGILIGAAFLHALAFPNFLNAAGWGFLACFTMIPFFWVIDRAHWRVVWLEGAIYGFVFYLVYNYWLKTFHPLAILIAPSLEALQYLLLFPILKLGHTLPRRRGYLLQTLLYVTYSFLTQQGFLGYPYGNLASAFYAYPVLIQIVSITGVWGLVFLMAAPQSWIASFLNRRITLRESRVDMVVYAVLVAFQLVFGLVSYHHYEKATPSRTFRIAAVQHSADSWKGGYETYKANYQVLKNASVEALQAKPDMILWSETAFVPSVSWHTEHPSNYLTSQLVDDFVSFGKSLPVPLVTGNPEGLVKDKDLPPFLEDGSWNWKTYNTVILFGGGNILGTYRKQHLVPFTEYFPYEKEFPCLVRPAEGQRLQVVGEGDGSHRLLLRRRPLLHADLLRGYLRVAERHVRPKRRRHAGQPDQRQLVRFGGRRDAAPRVGRLPGGGEPKADDPGNEQRHHLPGHSLREDHRPDGAVHQRMAAVRSAPGAEAGA
ncbi:MAG: apolipoprotein N-acyltransferase [Sphaerochaeta sp.]|nr:apolipoprotein N-acyltransferase [Sphaerochaeta sp.]